MRKPLLDAKGAAGVDVPALRRRLLAWYGKRKRDLPWRRTADPYAVWVSEVMLQQTRVDVVVPYFEAWVARFPTVQALAAATEEDVLRCWSGLGYYSRARNLHAAAKAIVQGSGAIPESPDALRRLPGIGPYTAAAVASIAFGVPVACVDGNVERVVARLVLLRGDPKSAANARALRETAQAWLAPRRAGDWNQAMMELGATVCTPRAPRCTECPVAALCPTKAAGLQTVVPGLRTTVAAPVERRSFAVVEDKGRLLLVRNPAKGLLAGLWSLPGGDDDRPLEDWVEEQAGVAIRLRPKPGPAKARHQFSHRTWEMAVHQAQAIGRAATAAQRETRWVKPDELAGEALPTAMRTALAAIGIESRPTTARAAARAKAKSRQPSAGRA